MTLMLHGCNQIVEMSAKIVHLSSRLPDELLSVLESITEPGHLSDLICTQIKLSIEDKQRVLETLDIKARLRMMIKHVGYELAILDSTEAIRLNPSSVEAHFNVGVVYVRIGQRDLAVKQLRVLEGLDKSAAEKVRTHIYR